MAEFPEHDRSSFGVRFLKIDGEPVTVIGSPEALDALAARLALTPDVEAHTQKEPGGRDEPDSAAA
jgi:hypothetical protein